MSIEQRRSERTPDYLPLAVHAINNSNGQILAGPFSGRIIDFSRHGACLLMTQIFHDGFHLFHTTRDTQDALLLLTIHLPPEVEQCTLTAKPVWLGLFRQHEIRAFKMGVEFTEDPEKGKMKEIRKALEENQGQRGAWWQECCRLLK